MGHARAGVRCVPSSDTGALPMPQVYWMALILKVALKLLTTGGAEDIRSDSEDEDGADD